MHKFNRIRQVAPMCPYGRTRCRHLSNNIEPSVYGGNAPYGKLLWPLVGHAHLHSRADSQSALSRVLYCGHSTQYNHVVKFYKFTSGFKKTTWSSRLIFEIGPWTTLCRLFCVAQYISVASRCADDSSNYFGRYCIVGVRKIWHCDHDDDDDCAAAFDDHYTTCD